MVVSVTQSKSRRNNVRDDQSNKSSFILINRIDLICKGSSYKKVVHFKKVQKKFIARSKSGDNRVPIKMSIENNFILKWNPK